MNDFPGMEDLLTDFLQEAGDLLADVDGKLIDLEKTPGDQQLLNDIFRSFHSIKGGAGFLNAVELVSLCHLTESLFNGLRNAEIRLTPELMDTILAATQSVGAMFAEMGRRIQPRSAPTDVIKALNAALQGKGASKCVETGGPARPADFRTVADSAQTTIVQKIRAVPPIIGEPDWEALYRALTQRMEPASSPKTEQRRQLTPRSAPMGRRITDNPGFVGSAAMSGRRVGERALIRESAIRVDTARLDQVLNLSGEIGLVRNRLTNLRVGILGGKNDPETLHALDRAVNRLDLLVSDLQNAVMKTRMQPIGRLFQKYPRIARDLARQLGKDVELVLLGEETEIDKTMIEDLADPLMHLVRNAVDHGIELPEERLVVGKSPKGVVRLQARQEGDHIVLIVADDGRGMNPEHIQIEAVKRGLIETEPAHGLDDQQSLNLIFLPGFSTMAEASAVSGRGVGMDVVKTNVQKLNGLVNIRSELGKGSSFSISLPLTLAILPVLLVLLDDQPFALPLSMVRETLSMGLEKRQQVQGAETLIVHGEVLPVITLSQLLGWPQLKTPGYGVSMQTPGRNFILAVDAISGRDDVMVKSLDDFRPRGVASVTTLSDGQIALILNLEELLADLDTRADSEQKGKKSEVSELPAQSEFTAGLACFSGTK